MLLTTIDQLTSELYQMIEELASTGFTPDEISTVIEMEKTVFLNEFNNKGSELYRRYSKGFLESEFKLRQRIFRDANNGSSPAQTLAKKILDDCIYKISTR